MKSISRPVIDRLPVGQIDEFACRQLDRVSAFVVVVLAFVPAVPSPPHPPSSLCPTSLYHRRLSLQPHIFSLASSPAGVICHALLRRRLASRARRVAPYPNSPTRSEPNQEMTFRGRQRIPCSRFERCAGSTRRRERFCAVRLSRVGPRIGPARRRGGAGAGAVVARVYPTVLPGSPLAPGASRMLSSFAAGLLLLLLLPLLLAFFTRCMDGRFLRTRGADATFSHSWATTRAVRQAAIGGRSLSTGPIRGGLGSRGTCR